MKIERNWYKELKQESQDNKFWTRGTKTNVCIALIVVGILLCAGALQAVRTITDTSDTVYTKIICGNGNTYDVSFANLVLALALGTDVSLPPCNITITSTLTGIESGTTLHGAGKALSILWATPLLNADMVHITAKNNITIRDICFDMNNRSQTWSSSTSMIEIAGSAAGKSTFITIDNCKFLHGTGGSLVNCEDGAGHITISNCIFIEREYLPTVESHWGSGIRFYYNWNTAKNNHFINMWWTAIYCERDSSVTVPSALNLIEGNFITGKCDIGIAEEGWGGEPGPKAGYSIIKDNVIWNLTQPDDWYNVNFPKGITPLNNDTVCGNVISNVVMGISVDGAASKWNADTTIQGNCLSDCSKVGINIEYSRHCTVSDNIVSNHVTGTTRGIRFYSSANNTCMGNQVKNCNVGIQEFDGGTYEPDYNIIIGNNCLTCTTDITKVGSDTICSLNQAAGYTGVTFTNTLQPFAAGWNSTRAVVSAKSGTWNSTSTQLGTWRTIWNLTGTQLGTWRTLWNSTRAVVLAKSATWNATSALLTSKSADWNTSFSDKIKLTTKTTKPLSPTEGTIYANSTTHNLVYYNGSSWGNITTTQNMRIPVVAPHTYVDGAIWFVTSNQTIAVYWSGSAYYFENDGSFVLPP